LNRTENRTDEQIKKDIVDHLAWDSRVDASKVKVEVNRGNVVLSGTVSSYPSRNIAYKDSLAVQGVMDVRNDIEVSYALPGPPDEEIRENARRVLDELARLDMDRIDVSVENGLVTVQGPCRSYWTKERAEEMASLVTGVTGIRNRLSVVPTEDLVDDAIAESIVAALDRNSEVEAGTVTVTVENGKVTLSGTVPTRHVRDVVYHTALYTTGVVHIEDLLNVRAP
jgi:osmotically-inducible protein OsmY